MEGKNNSGFSLVEVIVILAIIAIMTVGAGTMMYSMKTWNLTGSVQKIDVGLADAKADCMNKESGGFRLYKDGSFYYMEVSGQEKEKLGDERVRIFYTDSSGSEVEITASTELNISYNRGTGAFKEIGTNGAGTSIYCKEIKLERAGKTAVIKLEKSTGNHYIAD